MFKSTFFLLFVGTLFAPSFGSSFMDMITTIAGCESSVLKIFDECKVLANDKININGINNRLAYKVLDDEKYACCALTSIVECAKSKIETDCSSDLANFIERSGLEVLNQSLNKCPSDMKWVSICDSF